MKEDNSQCKGPVVEMDLACLTNALREVGGGGNYDVRKAETELIMKNFEDQKGV